jgi:outer membrane immunogenic protein
MKPTALLKPAALAAAALLAALASPALSADMVRPRPVAVPAPSWSGAYVGVHAGYAWGRAEVEDLGIVVDDGASVDGFIGGLLAGANFSMGGLVLGVEADGGIGSGHGTLAGEDVSYDLDWNAHLRARLGWDAGRLMPFVAAGVAFAGFSFTDDLGETTRATYVAPSLGVGVDYRIGASLLVRAEYLHDFYSMGSGLIVLDDYTASLKSTDTVRAALIYKFD